MRVYKHAKQFNFEEIDQPVSIVVEGPFDFHEWISKALTAIKDEDPENKPRWERYTRDFLFFLNTTVLHEPLVAQLFIKSVQDCREAIEAFIRTPGLGVKKKEDPDGLPRYLLETRSENYVRIKDVMIAIGKVTAKLTPDLFGGQDPAKLDNDIQSELRSGRRRRKKAFNRTNRADVMRYYRVAHNNAAPPRSEDPRIADRWLEAAQKDGVGKAFLWLVFWADNTGARSSSLLPLTLYHLLALPDRWGTIVAPNAKSPTIPFIDLVLDDDDFADFERWIDEELKRFGHRSLDYYRKLVERARAYPDKLEKIEAQLKKIPLFTEDGINPIKYERLARIFRSVAKRHRLLYRSVTGSGRFHTIKFHQLRHGYVFNRLTDMEGMDEAERAAELDALVAYIGWSSGEAMLEWYSHHYERLYGLHRALAAARRNHDRRSRPLPARSATLVKPRHDAVTRKIA